MRYRTLGKTGLRLSVIGLGTWQFGGEWGVNFSQAEADAILDAAAACGINFIDTAECYGPDHLSEKLIGDYLSRRDRSRWIVATKFGHHFNSFMNRTDDFSVAGVRKPSSKPRSGRCASRRLICINFIPARTTCFKTRSSGPCSPNKSARAKSATSAFPSCKRAANLQAREAAKFGAETLQVFYNRLDRRPEQIFFPHARANNLGIIGRVPLASGLLTGKYKPGATFAANDVRSNFDAEKMKRDLAEVARLQKEEVPAGRADGELGDGVVPARPAGVLRDLRLQKSRPSPGERRRGGVGEGQLNHEIHQTHKSGHKMNLPLIFV